MNFYFIAVNYNGAKFTEKYIDSINKIKLDNCDNVEIIIIDNDSKINDKNNLLLLEIKYNNVTNIMLNENLGYFKALNKGISKVDINKQSILVIGNNDVTFDSNFIKNFKKIEYSSKILVIAPNIITKDGKQQNPHVVYRVSKIEKLKAAIYNSNYYVGQLCRFSHQVILKLIKEKAEKTNNYGQMIIKRGIGATYVLVPNFFQYFDKLDDRVFMWGEEVLLSNQVESVNGCILYDPSIKIIHHESASVKNICPKDKYSMVKKSYKIYRKYL